MQEIYRAVADEQEAWNDFDATVADGLMGWIDGDSILLGDH